MNILITTASKNFGLLELFKDATRNIGKLFASNSKMVNALFIADEYVLTPLIKDESYIDFLLNYCKKNDITAIISFFDLDLIELSKNKERFKQNGITVVVSDEETIKTCNDKWLSYQFLLSIGLKQPKTYIDMEVLKQDLQSNNVSFPLIMKPRFGWGSLSIFQIDDFDELDVLYRKTLKEIFAIPLIKHQSINVKDQCIIVQEKMNGCEYGLDVLNDLNGIYVTSVAKKKLQMKAGCTGEAEVIDNNLFEHVAKTISSNLNHIGNIDVDFFLTDSGEKYVIDLNCRFGGQYVFSHLAGANFPKQIIEWLMGLPTSPANIKVKIGVSGKRVTHVERY